MAKLTARFDLEDKVSKKLKRIHKGFQEVEKKVKTINRQIKISIRAEDQAFYRLRKINDYIILKFAKSLEIKVVLDDQVTSKLDAIERNLKRLPKETKLTVSLVDRSAAAYKKIKKMLSNQKLSFLLIPDDKVTSTVKRIIGYIKKNLKNGYTVKLKVIDEITKTVNRLTALLRKFEKTYYVKVVVKTKVSDKINKKESPINKETSKRESDKSSDKGSDKSSDQKPGWVGKIKGWLKDWWTKSAWPWIKDTLNEIGKAFLDRFKERLIEKLKNDVFDKIIDKILGPQKKDDSGENSDTDKKVLNRNTGGNCCCDCCEGGISPGTKNKKTYRKKKSPTKAPNRTLKVPGEVIRRRQSGTPAESAPRTLGSKLKNWLGGLKSLGKDSSKLGKAFRGMGKAVPYVGSALAVFDLAGINKDNAGEKVGSIGGRIAGAEAGATAGAEAGATIGSFVGPEGTAIGGAIGGIGGGLVGGIGGEEAGKNIGKMFDTSQIKENISNTLFNGDWWNEKWTGVKTTTSDTLGGLSDTWTNIKDTASTTFFDSNWWAEKAGYAYGTLESTLFNSDWWGGKWESVKGWTQEKWDQASSVWNSVKSKVKETVFNKDWWSGKWEGVKSWAQEKWNGAVSVWESIKSKVKETVFNKDWWSGKWEGVKGWTKEKWENTKSLWKKFKSTLEDSLFNKDWWSGKWDSVKEWGKNILGDSWDAIKSTGGKVVKTAQKLGGGVTSWVKEKVDHFQKGREKAHRDFGMKADKNATGGFITKPTISWIGEAGKEFVIPVDNNRGRGKMLLAQAASKLGMHVVDDMASASTLSGGTALNTVGSQSASMPSSINTSSLNGQASDLGQQFSEGFGKGISNQPVKMEDWKKKNINTPFTQMISASPNYGKQMVSGYAKGQNGTATGTDGFLQSKVKTPYQATVNKSSSWGTGTVKGFAQGQNSTQTGTAQYVSTHVDKPFLRSKDTSNSWGSGLIGNFVTGMNSKSSEVKQAAKDMAKRVEQAFREELDIHSPSRVMMSLGRFASIGVVKGLGSVDVKKYAEKQAGSLAAAYSGMGAMGGNVKQWIMAALMATKTPISWLPGLMTIAQHESGGNPNAINLWDSNAKAGHPSQGLMQTIPSTFNDHKAPGMGNIRNPIHNAAAAIGYIKSRYGSINNVPGIKSLNHGGPYVGYANGGLITKEQIARVGEGNKREWIIPEERGIRGRYLLQRAAQALGMEVTDPSQSEQSELSSGQVSAVTSGTRQTIQTAGTKEIKIEFNGDQHFHNGQDAETLAAKIKQALIDELQKDINIGTKGVVAFD
ncbi:transglycosylase SLT domain-containing protein [Bacillus subtilis]|uniref:transglycosylase SLT domain-containing protein n=1 Tax=Bacillus subtilis TaxID=1423 RepID=UPI00133124DB|nr:transglycosylase SLT domain-containing protein [Bacillus subtilis]MCT6514036.1 transglycosylase SLT domain-containing protein [Bacillus subtilis]MCX4076092.1 transglycosylase SLT domain-containing protein [Bacillus subtilis]MEC0398099.1 transglycosylase SLT domain-containing protein [Bacillus subtilis]MEC0433244.1 transglycosylase SLT domain-containing protein [Bacillus subtilis]WRU07872.1 transglycosylase SLT domain-containing protein [Bacillus subtilis]